MVDIANGVFLQDGVSLRKEFERDLDRYYNSSVKTVDFASGGGGRDSTAQRVINKWVSLQTKGRISSLIDKPLSSDTRMLIVNALVLDAQWLHSFDPTMTAANGIFHLDSSSKLEIPMMAGKFQVSLGESKQLGCRLLELPFRGKRLSMFILLPNEDTPGIGGNDPSESLRRLEAGLNSDTLKQLFSSLTVRFLKYNLIIIKFLNITNYFCLIFSKKLFTLECPDSEFPIIPLWKTHFVEWALSHYSTLLAQISAGCQPIPSLPSPPWRTEFSYRSRRKGQKVLQQPQQESKDLGKLANFSK